MKAVLFEDTQYKVMECGSSRGTRSRSSRPVVIVVDKLSGRTLNFTELPEEVMLQCPLTAFER